LSRKQVSNKIPDVTHFDLTWLDGGIRNRVAQDLRKHIVDFEILTGPVSGEISLATTQYVDGRSHYYILRIPSISVTLTRDVT